MKKLIVTIFVLVIAGVAWWMYQRNSVLLGVSPSPTVSVSSENTPDEHSDPRQDLVPIVSASIVGKWQSTDDAKFVREFKVDGKVTDRYENKTVTSGAWQVFTKDKPLSVAVAFALETDTAYLQIAESGSQTEKLNFKLVKLTPEELELVFMDRGGTLKFTRIK